MKVIHGSHEIYAQILYERQKDRRVGIVPTMGALHEGHLSLVARAKRECDVCVTTIFVNPTQFGPNEDLSRYPRTLESDLEGLRSLGCDFVFVPASDQVYRPGHSTYIEPPQVANLWEGAIRPGHFRGVTTIVLKLFHLIPAHVGYFGVKDYQQVAVLKAMIEDLDVPIRIETCETIRESDGLAMSSRNRYLSQEQRSRAVGLWRCLQAARAKWELGCTSVEELQSIMRTELETSKVDSIDYAAIVHPDSMVPLTCVEGGAVAIVAARLGGTRLIDNMALLAPQHIAPNGV
jgi:pantoate--beta-alanine ligase